MKKELDRQIFKLFKPARLVKLTAFERGLMTFNFKLNLWLRSFRDWFRLPAKTPRFLMAVAASLVLLLFVGGSVWALEKTKPGDFFYPVHQKLDETVARVVKPKVVEGLPSPEVKIDEEGELKRDKSEEQTERKQEEKAEVEDLKREERLEEKIDRKEEKAEGKVEKSAEKASETVENVTAPVQNTVNQTVEAVREVLPNLGL